MPPKRHAKNNQNIQAFFGNGNKKDRKEIKEKQKQFIKCPLLGSVGFQLRRVLQKYRNEIMKEFNFGQLVQQLGKIQNLDQIGDMLSSILYLNVTKMSDIWSDIYTPDHIDDLISQENAQFLKHWLKNSFSILAQDQVDQSESWYSQSNSMNNQNWNYQMLNIYGASGKMSTLLAIARAYKIDVLFTYNYTEKREFEEMFASQHIKFTQEQENTEFGNKKKIIVHRGTLPKFINSRMLQIQRVPFIWITDCQQNHELFDNFELVQYSHNEIVKYIYLVSIIEQNYKGQLDRINTELKRKVIYENIKESGGFFVNFTMQRPSLRIQDLEMNLDYYDIFILTLFMKGNMRNILNWLQFHKEDENVHSLIAELKLSSVQLPYMLKNQLPLFRTVDNISQLSQKAWSWYDEQCVNLINDIVENRQKLFIESYGRRIINSKRHIFLINHVLKINALSVQTFAQNTRLRRLNKETQDFYKPLSQLFESEEQYEMFKQFDKFSEFLKG
ncbi:unnamed protein product (macronuclear) [Paramecium tetraurelia]|uniref:Uncharacterized protein n=1 Tax=Paramecium tetraurelia TaxID=5888 RepID=A0DKW8_PARTE|nr:uncharacterized protein GSPATT00018002001 [Paramecium tetraurelia]CAK83685.1 unnamed protein product [Paramecium tetraurelia]|eukprot:XP_001451082.1 hypothetical protein (macronuclear) [Paramecium tetraurelia strain d4-2]